MLLNTNTNHKVPERGNIKGFREMLGIKQDRASPEHAEGTWMEPAKFSLFEQKGSIYAPLLPQISAALKIPIEAIQNFDEEQVVNMIANTFGDNSIGIKIMKSRFSSY